MSAAIRPFQPGDEEGIAAVIKSVFDEYGWPWDPKSENRDSYEIEAHYHQRGGGFWVLEEDGAIIGTVGLRGTGTESTLYRLYLPKTQRGNGYGKLLFTHAIAEAKSRGYRSMEIWSDKTLDISHVMYKRAGAESIGDRDVFDADYGVPYSEWGYRLDLDKF